MEQTRKIILPLIGKIQHGEQQGNRVKELGYFIAKSNNNDMQFLLNRFKEKYPQEQKIKVRFFDEEPLSIRNIRYNQSGAVCYCAEESTQGKEKTKNGWKKIECKEDCQYRQYNGNTKPTCNREGILKFLIPEVATDRIFIMKITGQISINRINDYIQFKKMQGESIIGDYIISLNKTTQTNKEGKTFNNYILDIFQDNNFISNLNPTIQQTNVSNNKEDKIEKNELLDKNKVKPKASETKTSAKNKKTTENTISNNDNKEIENFKDCYVLVGTYKKNKLKDGKQIQYTFANFADTNDQIIDVAIPHEYIEEIEECDIGTVVKLSLNKAGDTTFTNSLEFIEKHKKVVA